MSAKKLAEAEGIPYNILQDKKDLTRYFEELLMKKTLIISASNNYLFSRKKLSQVRI